MDLPEDRIEDVREFLEAMGATLDPIRNVTVVNEGAPDPSLLTGAHIEEIIRAINERTREDGNGVLQLPEFDASWTPRACEQLLALAMCFYHWDERNRIEYEISEPELGEWESVLREVGK